MENLQIILSIAGTAVGLLITTITFFAKFITNAKAKKLAENIIKIGDAMVPYIEQAEAFAHYDGVEKKEYVMTKANQFAIENGIAFNTVDVSKKIEELVTLTKQVNKRESQGVSITRQSI